MKNSIQLIFLFLLMGFLSQAQTADVVAGCIPLEVNFGSDVLSEYYWDFDDLASSSFQNPDHVFTTAGVYTVKLYEGAGNALIGEIEITVYPDPIIEIEGTPILGCSPLVVVFNPTITIDPDVSVTGYLWTFGDGNSSTLENPTHTYQNVGVYTVSLEVSTSLVECNKTEIFADFITVTGVPSTFTLNKISDCDVPATFILFNNSENDPDLQYFWDFGDGQTFMGYDPGSVTYDQAGIYTISLTIINDEGCESVKVRNVSVGPPAFDISPKDECINIEFTMQNLTVASSFLWDFGPGSSPQISTEQFPNVIYNTGGVKTISLTISNQLNCTNDTTFTINIQDPSASFTVDPQPINCVEPMDVTLTADDNSFATYEWNVINDNSSTVQLDDYSWPIRDSLHLHWIDSLHITLKIITDIGCEAEDDGYFVQRKPDAYFKVDKSRGCAPLNITFTDDSRSLESIVSWKWMYGNGDEVDLNTGDPYSYTFNDPGEYYVKLIIENDAGCIDTSAGLWILVGEQISSEYEIDKTEICLGETISITILNEDERIDSWHVQSDGNRFDNCWTSNSSSHAFIHTPGLHDLTITTEYNGCYWNENIPDVITVNGAKANVGYMTNCEDPYTVMFDSKSLGETSVVWDIPVDSQYTDISFSHTFPERGVVKVFLTAFDETSTCPESVDSAIIHIVDLEAKFDLPEFVCDNEPYDLTAESSIDVNAQCHKGYLWHVPDSRPRELGVPEITTSFGTAGVHDVTLIVEDINGCTDTLTKQTTSYGIAANFTNDKSNVCLPVTINFNDTSTSDTTIVGWEWSFGEFVPDISHEFVTSDGAIIVEIEVTDALGCSEIFQKTISVYNVESELSMDNGPGICVGESITFSATDFTSQGSYLVYDWDFGPFGTGDANTETVVFDQNGTFNIDLNYFEEQSGCAGDTTVEITVVKVPIADFVTDVDDQDEICHPAIIEFTNTSDWEGIVFHSWDFGDGITSNVENPFNSFAKGTYEVELIVRSFYGCKDTITKTYTLVGPEGDLTLDKNNICKGESITFTLSNDVDVNSYQWVFGDGTTEENVNPVEHTFDFNPPGGTTKVDLILKSVENGCEFILTEPISITELYADFDFIDSSYCEGQAFFENKSVGAVDILAWDFGNGETSSEQNPEVNYSSLGNYTVTLRVSDAQNICNDEISKEISIEEVADFIFFPNVFTPNGDGINDFFNVVISPGYEDVVKVVNFKVYNRWGNLLYDNENPTSGWDALVKSTPSPATVYAYFIELEIIDCNNQVRKGNVTIVR